MGGPKLRERFGIGLEALAKALNLCPAGLAFMINVSGPEGSSTNCECLRLQGGGEER